MARSLNKVQLIGYLGANPETRTTQTGLQVASFSLATNRQWTDREGALQEEVEWHNIVVWDRLAQICGDHLEKGRLVYVEGRLHTRSYEANGQKQYRTEIVASNMLMLEARNGTEWPQEPQSSQGSQNSRQEERPRAFAEARPVAAGAAASSEGGRGRRSAVRERESLEERDDMPF